MRLSLIFLIIQISSIYNSDILTFSYPFTSYSPYIYVNLTNDGRATAMSLNTNSEYTIIYKNDDLMDKCIKEGGIDFIIPGQDKTYLSCNFDMIVEGKLIVSHFRMLLSKDFGNPYEQKGMGVAYKYNDDNYSFMSELSKRYTLLKKQFIIEHNQQERKGFIHFGGMPNNALDTIKYKSKCLINEDLHSWNCPIRRITIGNNTIELNLNAVFDTSLEHIFESRKFFTFITREVLKKEVDSNHCVISENYDFKDILYCEREMINKLGKEISFEFNDTIISLPVIELFSNESNTYSSKFTYDFYQSADTRFVFGFDFIKKFNYTVFDYEDKSISFYSNTIQLHSIANNQSITKFYLIVYNALICLIGIFYIISIFIVIKE